MTTWKWLKQIIDQKAVYPQYSEDDTFYRIKLFDGEGFIDECKINKNIELEDKEDFENNYKENSNQSLIGTNKVTDGLGNIVNQLDTDNAFIVRQKAAKKGWSFWALPIEITTSTISGTLYCKDNTGTDIPGLSCKIYNNSGTEITTPGIANANLATCVKTVLDFEPAFDYEMVGGVLRINSTPSSNIRLWVVGAPDIAAEYGGSKEFASGINMKFMTADSPFEIDGRVTKYITYNNSDHRGKLRIILKHDAGDTVTMQMVIHMYKL